MKSLLTYVPVHTKCIGRYRGLIGNEDYSLGIADSIIDEEPEGGE